MWIAGVTFEQQERQMEEKESEVAASKSKGRSLPIKFKAQRPEKECQTATSVHDDWVGSNPKW